MERRFFGFLRHRSAVYTDARNRSTLPAWTVFLRSAGPDFLCGKRRMVSKNEQLQRSFRRDGDRRNETFPRGRATDSERSGPRHEAIHARDDARSRLAVRGEQGTARQNFCRLSLLLGQNARSQIGKGPHHSAHLHSRRRRRHPDRVARRIGLQPGLGAQSRVRPQRRDHRRGDHSQDGGEACR